MNWKEFLLASAIMSIAVAMMIGWVEQDKIDETHKNVIEEQTKCIVSLDKRIDSLENERAIDTKRYWDEVTEATMQSAVHQQSVLLD